MRRCVVHVGVPKSGTTYLQDLLWDSTVELREQGFRLPLRSVHDHFFLTLALRGRLDSLVDPPGAVEILDRFRRDLETPGTEHLIVSHELFAPVEAEAIDGFLDLLSDFEVHVVVTARDLARQIPAEWQQQTKTRAEQTYDTFLDEVVQHTAEHFWSVQDVAAVAARWGRRLPPERVHVVTVPPPGESPDLLVTRFCSVVGLDPARLHRDQARSNRSLGYEQTELVRRINAALGDRLPHPRQGYNGNVKFWFAETVLAQQQPHQRLVLPAEHWEWCRTTSKAIVERLERAGYDVVGNLSDLVPGDTPDTAAPHGPSDTEVAAAAVEAIAWILDDRYQRRQAGRQEAPREAAAKRGQAGAASRFRMSAQRIARRLRA